MSAPRSEAQLAASRLNGAKSRGPLTPEGKARASRNALRHGLTASKHILIEGEDQDAYAALLASLVEEHAPGTATEAELVLDLVSALWRRRRAVRLEQRLFAWAPVAWIDRNGPRQEIAEPAACFDVPRFNAVRQQQAALGREVDRTLAQLRRLRAEREAWEAAEEAEVGIEKEPEPGIELAPAEAQEAEPVAAGLRNEPEAEARPEPQPGPAAPGPAPSPNEPGRVFSAMERLEIGSLIMSGDMQQVLAGVARAGLQQRVLARLQANPALGLGPATPSAPPA